MVPADAEMGVTVSGEKYNEILQTSLSRGEVEVGTLSGTTPKLNQNNTKSVEKEKQKKKKKKNKRKKKSAQLRQYNLFYN